MKMHKPVKLNGYIGPMMTLRSTRVSLSQGELAHWPLEDMLVNLKL